MTDNPMSGSTPEQEARRDIDAQLEACGWVVQNHQHAAVAAAQGVAVREVSVGKGRADYVLFVDRQAVGVIEAKPVGTTLTGVEPQTLDYQKSYFDELPAFKFGGVLPFGYESTGVETRFTCGLDPVPTSRRVFSFHRPETIARWVDDHIERKASNLRGGLQLLPDLEPRGLWPAQAEAVRGLEGVAAGQSTAGVDPDDDGCGQDVHGRQRGVPAHPPRRGAAGAVPGGSGEPGRSGHAGVRGIRHA